MPIQPSSLAVAVGAGVQNAVFTPAANDIPRNIVVIGTFNPSLSPTAEVPRQISSPAEAGVLYGQGYMLARLLKAVFSGLGAGGATVWAIPQAEAGGAAAATSNTFAITGPASAAGTLAFYVSAIRYAISVSSGMTATQIGDALVAAMAADPDCPCTGINTTGTVALTSKSKGPWGNSIPVAVNIQPGDAMPSGVSVTVTALSGGTGVPTIANALAALGTGSGANTLPNGQGMTDLVHGYLASGTTMPATAQDQTTVTAISTYNGLANADPPTGCYDHLVGKPFRCILGDATNSASLPSALTAFTGANIYDRTSAILCVAGSRTHPCEIAAIATGVISVRAGATAHRPYMGMVLPGVEAGPSGMWTADYANRDAAVKAGLSPTIVQGGAVVLQNIVTMYAGNTGVPVTSNGYREWVNLCKLQNIIASMLSTFRSAKWQGITIVSDTAAVTDPVAKQYVRSISDVIDELIALAKAWEGKGWIYTSSFTIAALKAGGAVAVRTGGDGFVAVLPGILSGVGNIIDTTFRFDISLAGVA